MNETVDGAKLKNWFDLNTDASNRRLVVIADDEHQSMIAGDLMGTVSGVTEIDAYQPDGFGLSAAHALSAADGVVIVTGAGTPLSRDVCYHIGQAALLGPRRTILVIDGADNTEKSQQDCEALGRKFAQLVAGLGVEDKHIIPLLSGGAGSPSWYTGGGLDVVLASVLEQADRSDKLLRAVVHQCAGESDQLSCRLLAGRIAVGDAVKILPGARQFEIVGVSPGETAGEVDVKMDDPHGAARGNILCAAGDPVLVSDQFESNVVWFGPEPMLPGRPYVMHFAAGSVDGNLANPKYVINLETLEHLAAKTLEPSDIGVCNLSLDDEVPFAAFRESRALGGFSIVDKYTGEIVGAGAINFALRRASNIHWQALDLNKATRAGKLDQKPSVLWFTGLSGSGKSTIANLVEKKLYARGHQTYLLDGDNVRHGLNRDLGFTDADRVENIRRVAEVAKLMADAGLIVLASFISPFRSERRMARDMMDEGEFLEVYVETPLEVCEQRDVKGLYVKARRGEIKNFTGIDSDYELPELAEITLDTTMLDAENAADEIIGYLERTGRLNA